MLLSVFWITSCAALAWSIFDPMAQFLLFGAAACGIVTMPMMSAHYNIVSPWSLVALMVYIGCGIRGFFIALEIDGAELTINELFLLGRPPSYFVVPSLIYLMALTLMAYAYHRNQRAKHDGSSLSWLADLRFGRQLGFVVTGCAIVGLAGFLLYAQRTDGLNLTSISAKRTMIDGLGVQDDYQAYGFLRTLNDFSAVAFWMMLAKYSSSGMRHSLRTRRGLLLVLLFVNASLLPIYASQRTDIAYLIITAVAIEICLRPDIRVQGLLLRSGIAIVIGLTVLTLLRVASQTDKSVELSMDTLSQSVGGALVYNRNFSDIPTSSHIINAIPGVLPYRHGETIYNWIAAPIPRSLWPEKPLISAGKPIGIKLFGLERSGVPPGAVAEMYWNFGLIGVVLGSLSLGWLFRRLHDLFAGRLARPGMAVIYSAVIIPLGGQIMITSVGQALFNAAIDTFLLLAVLSLSRAARLKPARTLSPLGRAGGQHA